jgi:hypothetical protein
MEKMINKKLLLCFLPLFISLNAADNTQNIIVLNSNGNNLYNNKKAEISIGFSDKQRKSNKNQKKKKNNKKNVKIVKIVKNVKKNKNIKIYDGELSVTKNVIVYKNLKTTENCILKYPFNWKPIIFQVKNFVNNSPKNTVYGWKLIKIENYTGKSKEVYFNTGGAVIVNNIKAPLLSFIKIKKWVPFAYISIISAEKNLTVYIDNTYKRNKKIIIENNSDSFINIKCVGNKAKTDIFYKGDRDLFSINKNKKCHVYLVNKYEKSKKLKNKRSEKQQFEITIDKNEIAKIFNKYTWKPEKDIIYLIKYTKGSDKKFVGIIFGVDLKKGRVVKKVPVYILEKIKYKTKIKDKEGNVYYVFDTKPETEQVLYNHKMYQINVIQSK